MKAISLLEFEVLIEIESQQNKRICKTDLINSFDNLNIDEIVSKLNKKELIRYISDNSYELTLKGYETLEPYRVKKVIFFSAGCGSRMMPITLNVPKPLIMVHGKKIIETMIDAVVNKGIKDITIIRGYLAEQFEVLQKKYPFIKFIDNPFYNDANNISSAYVARHIIGNSYVIESDLILYNPKLIRKYEYVSNYLGMKVEKTDDYCFKLKDEIITDIDVGGKNVHRMYGVSYWTEEDGTNLSKDIERVFNHPCGKDKRWDEIALKDCKEKYNVHIREIKEGDIVKVGTYNELKSIDAIYDINDN